MLGSARTAAVATIAALVAAVLAIAGGSAAGETGQARPATAAAQAFARQEPSGARRDLVSIEGDGRTAGEATRVRASIKGLQASASAGADVADVDVFSGLVTAERVVVGAVSHGDGVSLSGSVTGLAIEGEPVESPDGRTVYDLHGYGRLVALGSGPARIVGLRVELTEDYEQYPAGSVIRVASATARARDGVAPPEPEPEQTTPAEKPEPKPARKKPRKHRLTRREKLERAITRRQREQAAALLAKPGYAFPVAGDASFSDDWGAPRQDTGTHVGNDVFAPFGTPVVAVADGTLYRVGTRTIPGNRVWLRDHEGHRFFYAHLSDFAAAAFNGADVHAGEVIGFVGSTGDAEQTPPHLHFEVHLPDHAPVNPFPFLTKWQKSGAGTARWLRRYGEDPGVRPGALVVVKDFLAEP